MVCIEVEQDCAVDILIDITYQIRSLGPSIRVELGGIYGRRNYSQSQTVADRAKVCIDR